MTGVAEISAALVKELRDATGAGMMDCKRALQETNGDMDAAVVLLREKGMAQAAKRAGRATAQGTIGSYIHLGGRIGVLVEVKVTVPPPDGTGDPIVTDASIQLENATVTTSVCG